MPKVKLKLKGSKTVGLRFEIEISFEWPRKLLSKRKAGILVKGETFTITKEGQFAVSKLEDLVGRGYLKQLPKKARQKKKK